MKSYTMQEACNALAIDSATLYRWIKRAGIDEEVKKQEDEQDKRRRSLSQAQVQQLARLHHRSLAQTSIKPEASEITELRTRIEVLEREMSKAMQRLDSLTAQTGISAPTHQKTPRIASQRVVSSEHDTLPDDFVSAMAFASQHGMHVNTIRKAIASERLPTIVGKWKQGRAYVVNALDAPGRARFYALYRDNPHFTPCPDCPHA